MRTILVSLSALVTSVFLLVAGNAYLTTILGARLVLDGHPPRVAGPTLVFYSFGFLAGTLRAHALVWRVGHVRAFAALAAIACVAALLYPIVPHPVLWAALRGITGFAMAGLMLVIESWLSAQATPTVRGTLFGIYMVAFYLSTAVGQLLVALVDLRSFMPFSIAAMIVTVSLVPLALTRYAPQPSPETPSRLSFAELFRTTPQGFVAVFVSGMVFGSFYLMGPAYALAIGFPVSWLAGFMATAVLAGMVFAWPAGRFSDGRDRRQILAGLVALGGLAGVGIAALPSHALPSLFVLVALFLGPAAAIYPISMAITADRVSQEVVVPASRGLLLANGAGACVGPLLAAGSMHLLGPSALFVFAGGALLFLASVLRASMSRQPPAPVKDQGEFVHVTPATGPAIVELDPRAPMEPELDSQPRG